MDKSVSNNPQYFEGTLQLRNCSPEVISFAKRLTLKHPKAYISKEQKVTNGYDFYFSDNKFLRILGKKLQESFTGELKITATLHTKDKQSSKELYRLTVLFRQLSFSKGDTFLYQEEEVEILSVTNTDVLIRYLKTGEKKHIGLLATEKAVNHSR